MGWDAPLVLIFQWKKTILSTLLRFKKGSERRIVEKDYARFPLLLHLRVLLGPPTQCSGNNPFSRGTTLPQPGQMSRSTCFILWTGKSFEWASLSS